VELADIWSHLTALNPVISTAHARKIQQALTAECIKESALKKVL